MQSKILAVSLLICFSIVLGNPGWAQEKEGVSDRSSKQSKEQASSDPEINGAKPDEEDKKQKPGLRQINLSGTYSDHPQSAGFDPSQLLLGGSSTPKSFFKLVDFIDELAEDDDYDYVLFDLSSPFTMNSVQLDQLTRHLEKLNQTKKTFAWLENAGNAALCVASCCDKVIMADFAGIDMPSNSMQSMFFGDAFDLLGVEASVVRAGNFKGAVEPFLNAKMSRHLRQHNVELLTSLNDTLVDRIARSRGLKKAHVRELQRERMLLPEEAVESGLVDVLAPYGTMQQTVKDQIAEEINWVTPKKANKKDMSFFQLMSEIMSGPSSSKKFRKNTIAVIHLDGMIVDGKKKSPGMIVSGPTVKMIEQLTAEDRVKGAVIRINSPGGSATASEAIRQALVKLAEAKPTVVSMGGVAASGGYWVSCIDTPVYAERGTVTGSIGVFSMKVSAGALMRRIGIHLENITLDDSANAFALDQSWNEGDMKRMQKTVDMVYDRFLQLVSDSRDISMEQLQDLAGGRVWTGSQALAHNLIDHIGGLDHCLELIAKKAELGGDYSVAHRPLGGGGLDIASLLGGSEEEIFSMPKSALRWMQRSGLDLRQTRLILNESLNRKNRTAIWLFSPFEFSIN